MRALTLAFAGAASALMLTGCNPQGAGESAVPVADTQADTRPELAIMTSLPILWAEGDVAAMLASDEASPVRAELESAYALRPIDRLTELNGARFLMLAQPRALAGDENVALDDWVRAGGHVLVLADPMLTQHSEYGLGDARGPQRVALLSPILARWGLKLTYDPASSPNVETLAGNPPIPVRMAGRFELAAGGHESRCALGYDGLVADCAVGTGRALIVADAYVLESGDHAGESRPDSSRQALDALLARVFAGERASDPGQTGDDAG